MLKPIHRVECSPALDACQRMMQGFALWLCEQQVHAVDVTKANLQLLMPPIEANWLWQLLTREVDGKSLLERAQAVAALSNTEKHQLILWIQAIASIGKCFCPVPAATLPTQRPNNWSAKHPTWTSFKTLLVSFYTKGLKDGLPYRSDGVPTNIEVEKVTYKQFVLEFRTAHKLDVNEYTREICVLCGGELKQQEVDHWVNKGSYPLLSVCADNLLPICSECNAGETKGQKQVHSDGNFSDWFHPYLRPGNGSLRPEYQLSGMAIRCVANQAPHQPKVDNLDKLLNLSARWTREFKAEYRKKQKEAADRIRRGRSTHDLAKLEEWLTDYQDSLVDSEPNYEVHKALAAAMLEPSRLAAWYSELGLVT